MLSLDYLVLVATMCRVHRPSAVVPCVTRAISRLDDENIRYLQDRAGYMRERRLIMHALSAPPPPFPLPPSDVPSSARAPSLFC